MKKLFFLSLILLVLSGYTKSPIKIKPWPLGLFETSTLGSSEQVLMDYDDFIQSEEELREEMENAPKFPFKMSVATKTAATDYHLIKSLSPVKNQGSRGQCHNFSVTAALEFAVWAGEEEANNFSEQCNAWKFYRECQNCNGDPLSNDDGGYAAREIFFIKDKFMKFEKDFPYQKSDASKCQNEYNNSPFKSFTNIDIYTVTVDQMKKAIEENFVVIGEFSWYSKGWDSKGAFPYKDVYDPCTSANCGGHAILIAGFDDNYYGTGKGGFIFKNSWGSSWSDKKGDKPEGYGVMPYPYVNQFKMRLVAVSHKNAHNNPFPDDGSGCSKK